MTDQLPPRTHNMPPDPIDDLTGAYEAPRLEAENWLDGQKVEDEAAMKAVDALRKEMREYRLALEKGQKSASAPLYDAYKAELARWKPTIDDAKTIEGGLVALGDGYKQKLAAEKRAAERAAWEAAEAKRREAEAKAREADKADISALREAEEAKREALEAEKTAQAARKDRESVKGLRTVKESVVVDPVALARHLWQHDREELEAWQADRARKLGLNIPGVVEIRERQEVF
ncbi:MAG: hypothetical protein GOVbin7368_2 [Prokaryotic dsDNA virus sp.]|nr:MAG: hypothetical protein GOVbin7368_2 [Prokaryotic dsDNA virus sp.]|tara:strand:- start:37020 stop:37715 length:696 start_codon:yes stop_codon:yes gene_type:complete